MAGQRRRSLKLRRASGPLPPPPPCGNKKMRDRISQLPDEILLQILSLLPTTKLRASTSVLSRRWRHLWTHCPSLDLRWDDRSDDAVSSHYADVVDYCVRACRASTLQRFAADVVSAFDEACEEWVQFAAERSVGELSLRFFEDMPFLEPPRSLLACSPSLTALKLRDCDLTNFPCRAGGFPSLRSLHLACAIVPDEKLPQLLSMCPLLESLCLQSCRDLGSVVVSCSVNPRLRNLKITGVGSAVVCVPGLESLRFCGSISRLSLEGARPRLREAELFSPDWDTSWSKQQWKVIMSAIADVEILSVNSWFFELMARARSGEDCNFEFKNLKELHWDEGRSITDSNLDAFFHFLQGCPQLEKLYVEMWLQLHYFMAIMCKDRPVYSFAEKQEQSPAGRRIACRHDPHAEKGGRVEEPVSERVLPRLKSATVFEFSNKWHDLKLVELVLREAPVLGQLLLHSRPEQGMDKEDVIRELVSILPRASPSAEVALETSRRFSYVFINSLLSWKETWAF